MNPFPPPVSTLPRNAGARPGPQATLRGLPPLTRLGAIAGGPYGTSVA